MSIIQVICDMNLAACVNEYFVDTDIKDTENQSSEDPIYEGYEAVLDSKSKDEALVRFSNSFA